LSRTVSVAFPVPLRRTFAYTVPPDRERDVAPGMRVRAPLGERLLGGVITELDPELPAELALRPLADILDTAPALSPELLESTRRLAERFVAPWGEILRAALPAGLPAGEETGYRVTAAGAAALALANGGEARILRALLDAGRRSVAQLRPEAGEDLRATLRDLEQRGLIRPDASRTAPPRPIEVTYVAAAADPARVAEAAGRSRKAREAFDFLRTLGRAATAEELRRAGFGAAVMRRLAEGGVVSIGEQNRRPDPPRLAGSDAAILRLTPKQAEALDAIGTGIEERRFRTWLLYGVTGSGKTEIYLRAIARTIASGRGAVWLVPEIALTPVFARSLLGRFGDDAVVLHSALGQSHRAAAWQAMRSGAARVVIGPRSAVFAPVADPGLFIVDEEQDASYKQSESPRYDARDAAAIRAAAHGAVLVLGSATPSMETYHAAQEGKIGLLRLPERVESRPLPRVSIVDLRRESALPEEKGSPLFSAPVVSRLEEVFDRGEQAILLVPRRGYAPFLLCRACGNDFRCDACSVASTVHRRPPALLCHYCGRSRPVPERCDLCGGKVLEAIGAGTERAAERFAEIFPGVRAAVLDSDAVRRRGGAAAIIASMESGAVSALIGTQMVAKGHHFPRVTAIAVLSTDTLLNFPDFRAAETTFQLLAQAAGRAGRGDSPGTVHIQTFHPESPAIQRAAEHDSDGFAAQELEFRRAFFYPPFCELAEILVSGPDRDRALAVAREIAAPLSSIRDLRVTGPAPAPLERLVGRWRYQVIVRSRSRRAIVSALDDAVPVSVPAGVTVAVDVDPRNLM
jgi:primosomal protein N' (replication factor Y)